MRRRKAEWFAETKRSDVLEGKADPPPDISLKNFTEEHLQLMKGQISYNTLREHKRVLRYLLEVVGNCLLRRISTQDAEMYVRQRSDTGVSACTINKEISTLRRIFTLAANRRGYLPEGRNPFQTVKNRKVSRKPIRYISIEEFEHLLAAAPTFKWKVYLSLLYTTGLRLGEACHLTWADIDFELGIVRVSAKRDSTIAVPWEPKDHELREIPLSGEMVSLLAEWQAHAPENVPYVFLTRERYSIIMAQFAEGRWHEGRELINNVLRDFKTIQRRAGVLPCTIHDLRRSCITNWARFLSAHVVRLLAGHSSLQTTMNFYLSVQDDDLEKAKNVSSDLFAKISGGLGNLESDPTDPLLTHFGQKWAKIGNVEKKPCS